jgi:excinuclease ABC subunit C
MGDGRGKVLYVGKARDLRARLHNYAAPGGDGRPTVPHLLARVKDVRCIVTATEKEALLLENTLIKRHRPPFNIFFRDDKEYLLLRIDPAEEFPRPELVRRAARDGASYFGPYSSAKGIRETLRELLRLFPLAPAPEEVRLPAPAVPQLPDGAVPRRLRREGGPGGVPPVAENAARFLRGEYKALVAAWKAEMGELSGRCGTRRRRGCATGSRWSGGRWRGSGSSARWRGTSTRSAGTAGDGATVASSISAAGGLPTPTPFVPVEGGEDEALSSFLLQHYAEGAFFPKEVLLPFPLADRAALSAILSERAGHAVSPAGAFEGGAAAAGGAGREERRGERPDAPGEEGRTGLAERMASLFSLPAPPMRIEGYDISNTAGTEPVGSMVAFVGGKPAKKWYRKFSIRGLSGPDDFAMMEQVVRRRFGHEEDFGELPDLVLIDGGKGQLSAAEAALRSAGKDSIPVISLAKERVRGGETVFRERVFLPGRKTPGHLAANDPALHLLIGSERAPGSP